MAHGLLVLSLIDGLRNQTDVQLKARASMGQHWCFKAPVLSGDTIDASYQIDAIEPAKTDDQSIPLTPSTPTGAHQRLPRIRSLAFSAIMMVGALVFEPIKLGITDESQIRIFSSPCTPRVSGSTTAISSTPILQVQLG